MELFQRLCRDMTLLAQVPGPLNALSNAVACDHHQPADPDGLCFKLSALTSETGLGGDLPVT